MTATLPIALQLHAMNFELKLTLREPRDSRPRRVDTTANQIKGTVSFRRRGKLDKAKKELRTGSTDNVKVSGRNRSDDGLG